MVCLVVLPRVKLALLAVHVKQSLKVSVLHPSSVLSVGSVCKASTHEATLLCRRTVTYAAIPTCIAVAAWDLTHEHEHHEEVPDYPYMRIRSKDFPWGPCGLFEMNCPDAEGAEE